MQFAAPQILIPETGNTAGPAITYSGKEPEGGTSFADLIRPQVAAGEETAPVSASPTEGINENELVPREMPANTGDHAPAGQPSTRMALFANLPGARVSAAAGATRKAGDAVAASRRATVSESTRLLGASFSKSAKAAGSNCSGWRPATEMRGTPSSVGGLASKPADQGTDAAPPGEESGIVPGDFSRVESFAGGHGSAAAASRRFSDPVAASSCSSSAPVGGTRLGPSAPAASHASHAGFALAAAGSGHPDSAAPAPPVPGFVGEEDKFEPSLPPTSNPTGQAASSEKTTEAPAHSEIPPGAVQGNGPPVGPIGVSVPARGIAVRALRGEGLRNNHGLSAPATVEPKKSGTPSARAHAVLPSQSTVAAGQQEEAAAAGFGSAAAAPAAPLATPVAAETRMQVVTADPGASAQTAAGAIRESPEHAGAGRRTSSGGEIVQGASQGASGSADFSVEAMDAGHEGPAKAGHSGSPPLAADPAGQEGLDKATGHTGWPTLATGPGAHTAANPGAASQAVAPAVLAAHAASGMGAMQPAIPLTSAPHSAQVPASAAFERMDSGATPQVIESTPQRLAVGVRSPGLGWVEVHASNAAGQVSAAVVAGSAESHGAVSAQLPSVREFLAGEHVRVDNLTSERFPASSGGGEGFSGGQSGHEARNQAGRESRDESGSEGGPSLNNRGSASTITAGRETESLSYINVRV